MRVGMVRPIFVQRALLATWVFTLLQFVASTVYAHIIDGYVGVDVTETAPFVARVDGVDPHSPPARDGLRPRDLLDFGAMSPSNRTDWETYLKVGKRYDVPIVRDGKRMTLHVDMDRNIADDPIWQVVRWQFYFGFVGILTMLALAGFLLLKRPDSVDVATLSATLILVALGEDFAHFGAWDTMNDALTQIGFALSPAFFNGGLVLLATYALRFAAPPSRLRRVLTSLAYGIAAAAAAAQAWDVIGYWRGTNDGAFGFFESIPYQLFANVAPYVLPLACALLAIRDARGAERSRVTWATGSLAIIYVSSIAYYLLAQNTTVDTAVVYAVKNFSFPIAAAGLTYALLGRRLLDVGFALNRAAVFAVVSLVVVGAFSLAEWALGGWLSSASRNTSVLVSASLALGLGLAIHPIHTLTDRFVDNVFFRKRHQAEQALRAFAKEAAFITDQRLIVERTIAILRARTDCSSAEILLYDGDSYGGVSENDPALVTLRASHELVRLRETTTSLEGEICFPMSAGGKLVGALVVGRKALGESFAPDECDAIAALAHGVGVALALLEANGDPAPVNGSAAVDALVAAVEALPEAVAAAIARATSARNAWTLPAGERTGDPAPPLP